MMIYHLDHELLTVREVRVAKPTSIDEYVENWKGCMTVDRLRADVLGVNLSLGLARKGTQES